MRVLVSNPSFTDDFIYLPYLWGRLRLQSNLENVEWLDPIYFADSAEELAAPYDKVDVLLLSCYVWNWEKNIRIAEIIKEKNPDCYIVAGGPQVTRDEQYSVCDYIWMNESELVIDDLLQKKIPENTSRVDLINLKSPYHEYIQDYKRFSKTIQKKVGHFPTAVWETNRGCPYKCTFCDWGSLTNSKIRRYNHETIIQDIEALADIHVNGVFNADANFGIFKEDLVYSEHLAKMKRERGFPRKVFFNSAKNKKDIVNSAAKVLYDHDMFPTLQISYQHTDEDVLKAIKRDNISTKKLKNELEQGFRDGIPLVGVVIIGNPGDTVDKWKKGFHELLEIGFHEDIRTHDFMMLPNAPASDPHYMAEHGIEPMKRVYTSRNVYKKLPKGWFEAQFIRSTKTFSAEDYGYIQAYTAFVSGYHILNVSRFIAMLLRYYMDVPYDRFYDTLLEQPHTNKLFRETYSDIMKWVNGERKNKEILESGLHIPHDFYIKARAYRNLRETVEDLKGAVKQLTSMTDDQIDELVKTQYRTMPGWWKQNPTRTKYNFIEAFKNLQGLPPNTSPRAWTLEEKVCTLRSSQRVIGDQIKVRIDDISDYHSWLHHHVHRGENARNKMNHYQEVLDNVLL